MSKSTTKESVRERIVATATDLFYRQGYRATGINQIIAESAVAKASFYGHFPSKEALLYEYASRTSEIEMEAIRTAVMALDTARERFFGPLHILSPWFDESNYRGCPFQILVGEVPQDADKVLAVAKGHREKIRTFIATLIRDLLREEPTLHAIDVDELTDMYVVLFEGTIATAVTYQELWPVTQAVRALEILLEHYRN